jgi:hypothetical protein
MQAQVAKRHLQRLPQACSIAICSAAPPVHNAEVEVVHQLASDSLNRRSKLMRTEQVTSEWLQTVHYGLANAENSLLGT